MINTSRLAIPVAQATDDPRDYPTDVDAPAKAILDNSVTITQGTLVDRPGATTVPVNTMYYTTDTTTYYVSNGSAWIQVSTFPKNFVTYISAGSNYTANAGDWVAAQGGYTITLPHVSSSNANALVAITALGSTTGSNPVTVTAGSSNYIYGVGLDQVTSFTLGTEVSTVILQSSSNSWYVISGQLDTGWKTLPLESTWMGTTEYESIPASYRLIGDRVYLKGVVVAGSGASDQFTTSLPSAIQSTADLALSTVLANSGESTFYPALVDVTSAMTINSPGVTLSAGVHFRLDGLSYSLS